MFVGRTMFKDFLFVEGKTLFSFKTLGLKETIALSFSTERSTPQYLKTLIPNKATTFEFASLTRNGTFLVEE